MSKHNELRAMLFEKPDHIPMHFVLSPACWFAYPQDRLCDLMEAHPFLFPGFRRPKLPFTPELGPDSDPSTSFTDAMGCVWHSAKPGLLGTVVRHPLADWADRERFSFPDPDRTDGRFPVDWAAVKAAMDRAPYRAGGLRHGHTFLQLCDLRGYQNLMFDMADEDERLDELIDGLTEFNLAVVRRWLDAGAQVMGYPEDLGMQVGPMLSPDQFRRYILPAYRRIMEPARRAGVIVTMHSDGDIRLLADDLVDGGVQVLNLQDLVNGIDWIRDRFFGRLALELDVDRQDVTVRGTPQQIDALIREEVEKLSTPQGGLMMVHGCYPGPSLENIAALMDAMEKYAFYWS